MTKEERITRIVDRMHKRSAQKLTNADILDKIHNPESVHYRDQMYLDMINRKNFFISMFEPLLREAYNSLADKVKYTAQNPH